MSCRKVRYRDRIGALMALNSAGRADQRREKTEKRAYLCPKCKGWHLTSQPARPLSPTEQPRDESETP